MWSDPVVLSALEDVGVVLSQFLVEHAVLAFEHVGVVCLCFGCVDVGLDGVGDRGYMSWRYYVVICELASWALLKRRWS